MAPRPLLLLVAVVVALSLMPAQAQAATCDRYVGPFGSDASAGSLTQPWRSPQHLVNNLAAGQTGCLLQGVYSQELDGPYVLNIRRGGAAGAPLTIRSAPGQRATIRGRIYVWEHAGHVRLSDLDIDGRRLTPGNEVGVIINSKYAIFERNTVTNNGMAICMTLGYPGFGMAVNTIVRENVYRNCGGTDDQLEHALYLAHSSGVLVKDNLFLDSGTYAVHLYPDATDSLVTHNVMAGNGGGVIFAGEGDAASSGNVVSHNVITGANRHPGVHSWWHGAIGQRNLAKDNCLQNSFANVDIYYGGFQSENNIIASPGYRDASDGDYRLAANSPCLTVVGYDTAAKLMGQAETPPAPTPTPTPTPTASASPTPTSTPAVIATPTPARTPTPTPSPSPTASPTRTPTATPTATATATPSPAATVPVPAATPPPVEDSTSPQPDPEIEPVEAAKVFVDRAAFSASGGNVPCRPRSAPRCR